LGNKYDLISYCLIALIKDLTTKQIIYAQAGILEYWVVNLQASELIVFRGLGSEGYTTETRLSDGNITPLSFRVFRLPLENYLPNGFMRQNLSAALFARYRSTQDLGARFQQ
jgi:Uma2 family endonuclease